MTTTEPNTNTATTGINPATANGHPEEQYRYSPAIITWAREGAERNGQTGLCERFPDLKAWEQGSKLPSHDQMSEFAEAIHIPYGDLIRSKPPPWDNNPSGGFYTSDGQQEGLTSWNLRDTLYDMLFRQDWLRGYRAWSDEDMLEFVGRASLQDAPGKLARDIRKSLGLESGWAARCANQSKALEELRRRVWDLGVVTIIDDVVKHNPERPLNPAEFRGFALSNKWAPFVFINGSVSKPAQTFTLVHELVHIWLGHSCTCIDVLDRLAVTGETGCEVEEFCNQVAAEVLLPAKEVRAAWGQAGKTKTAGQRAAERHTAERHTAERHTAGKSAGQTAKQLARQLASLAAQFKVSRPVMAWRACSLKLLPWATLEELRQDSRFVNHRRSPASKKLDSYDGWPEVFDMNNRKIGEAYARTVLGAPDNMIPDLLETGDLVGLYWNAVEPYTKYLSGEDITQYQNGTTLILGL